MPDLVKEKTFKREVAFLILLWLIYLSEVNVEALKIVVVPAFAFIGLAFGIDWWGKGGSTILRKTPNNESK